ncbi:MAG: aminotransferase class V-fold PLP-dependent enzyme [Planctomycetia bacterium]|nr:aminotransferase class V-fold PLP-dependent enzyme [Planctomycetia bacterium]
MPLSRTPDDAVYLDHAAATPLDPEVAAAMDEAAAIAYGNPSSPHAAGRAAKRILEDAREQLLQLIGGRVGGTARDRLVFTSGATEANRLGVVGLAGSHAARQAAGTVAISARDHSSLGAAATELGGLGWQVCELPLVGAGTVDFARAPARAEAPATRILTTTTVCGQTGIRDDLAGVARLATDGWLVHADATQAAAWDEIAFAAGRRHRAGLTRGGVCPGPRPGRRHARRSGGQDLGATGAARAGHPRGGTCRRHRGDRRRGAGSTRAPCRAHRSGGPRPASRGDGRRSGRRVPGHRHGLRQRLGGAPGDPWIAPTARPVSAWCHPPEPRAHDDDHGHRSSRGQTRGRVPPPRCHTESGERSSHRGHQWPVGFLTRAASIGCRPDR